MSSYVTPDRYHQLEVPSPLSYSATTISNIYTLFFFFIRTSNFDAEAKRSYIFWRFEAETFLKMFLNLPDKLVGSKVTALYENGWFTGTIEYYNAKLKEYKVNYLDNTSDFVSPDDFDGVEVILEQLWIGTTDIGFLKKTWWRWNFFGTL